MSKQPVIGIDVGKRQSQACLISPDCDERLKEFTFPHTLAGLRKLLALCRGALEKFGEWPAVILEATGHYSRLISDFLRLHGFAACVINPIQTKSFTNVMLRKAKTDRIDAFKIALFYRLGLAQPAREIPAASLVLRELCRHYFSLQRLLTNTKLKCQSLIDQTFWRFDEVFAQSASRAATEVLKRFPTPQQLVEQPPDEIAQLIQQQSHCNMSKALATFVGEIGSHTLYPGAAQIIAFAGVDPTVYQSGAYQGNHNWMSKRGSTWLRMVLYQAACIAAFAPIKHQSERYATIRAFYQKKLREGKPPRVALGAVMRKLCVYAYAVLSKNKDFENRSVSKKSATVTSPETEP
jgi:transposase